MENQMLCIVGPTASGKTALAVALAKELHTEIISADSMQIYQELSIGTAKPDKAEQQGIVHYMLDIIPPTQSFSVAQYAHMADAYAQTILKAGKIPIVVGGTGLYIDALIAGNAFAGEDTDPALRAAYTQMAQEKGAEYVHAQLQAVDPKSAEQLHPNNLKRVIRALEVYHCTHMTIHEWNMKHKRPEPKYQACMIGLCPASRELLYERINLRVDIMLEQGLLEETRKLLQEGKLIGTAAQAIGYKELLCYLNGQDTLENCIELLKRRSRNYAKRQLTWFRNKTATQWIYYDKQHTLAEITAQAHQLYSDFIRQK